MDMGVKEAKLDIVEVEGQGDAVIEVGRYRLSGAGGEMMDQGKYIVIWKQDEGRWKLHRDIWNSSEPPQGR
jgi:ketosteroid isomerase-like protein